MCSTVGRGCRPEEGGLSVGTRDASRRGEDLAGLGRKVSDQFVRGLASIDARFDRLDGEVAELKTDLAGVKTEVAGVKADLAGFKTEVAARFDRVEADAAETRQQLNRLEQAHQRHADRVEARFDQLVGLILRDETKGRGA